jgi:phosphatidylglycerol:prolipoprotein diacylglycerol transferase
MYLHAFGPFVWRLTDQLGIHWVGLSYMLSFFISWLFLAWLISRQRAPLGSEMVLDFLLISTVGALVGGRFGYCLLYSPDLLLKFRPEFPYWGGLALSEGGMSVFGSMIGLWLVATWYAYRKSFGHLYLYDILSLTAPLGLFCGRVASFFAGDFIGGPASENAPFTVKHVSEILSWPQLEPSRLPELAPLVEKVGLSQEAWQELLSRFSQGPEAQLAVREALEKVLVAIQSGDGELQNRLVPLLVSRHPAQLYSALSEGVLLFVFLLLLWRRPRRPGVITALFLILYGLGRFLVEDFRLPDPHLGLGWLDLTRGQWLSGGCFIIGVVLLFVWGRRETLPVYGWGRGHSVRIHRR